MIMKRLLVLSVVMLFLSLLVVNSVLALASGPPKEDAYVTINEPDAPHNELLLQVSGNPKDPMNPGECVISEIIYLKWNLSDIDIPDSTLISTATLTLTTVLAQGSGQLSLYAAGDVYSGTSTAWTENGLTYTNRPTVEWQSPLATIPVPTTGQIVTFSSPALKDYLIAQATGDNTASFALSFNTCSSSLVMTAFWAYSDKEGNYNSDGPHLLLLDPNAVELHSFRAIDTAKNFSPAVVFFIFVISITWLHKRTVKRT